MIRIRKEDIVQVIAGKDKGKKGRVMRLIPEGERAVVEGVNYLKKHVRRRREDEQAGIIQFEGPISLSNIMPYCKKCARPVRIGVIVAQDGSKQRICKRCGGPL